MIPGRGPHQERGSSGGRDSPVADPAGKQPPLVGVHHRPARSLSPMAEAVAGQRWRRQRWQGERGRRPRGLGRGHGGAEAGGADDYGGGNAGSAGWAWYWRRLTSICRHRPGGLAVPSVPLARRTLRMPRQWRCPLPLQPRASAGSQPMIGDAGGAGDAEGYSRRDRGARRGYRRGAGERAGGSCHERPDPRCRSVRRSAAWPATV
jgi:hypothetical protein